MVQVCYQKIVLVSNRTAHQIIGREGAGSDFVIEVSFDS